jgi:hypothetical protein
VTNPQDLFGNSRFGGDPFGRPPFGQEPQFGRPPFGQGPPAPPFGQPPFVTVAPGPRPRPPVNTLATLSVVFAFVFAPAGAILGHLGLSQIRRTGQRGRDRALVAVTLSYVLITVTVVVLVVWATVGKTTPGRVAAPPATQATADATTTTTTTTPPPTVAPADLQGLLARLDDVRDITGDARLTSFRIYREIAHNPDSGTLDRPECYGVLSNGFPEVYDVDAVSGYYGEEFRDTVDPRDPLQIAEGVVAFGDPPAAQKQLANLQSGWRQCAGSTAKNTYPSGYTATFSMGVPADAGNGITTIDVVAQREQMGGVHAIAAKANVVVDLFVFSGLSHTQQQAAVDIANVILAKITH